MSEKNIVCEKCGGNSFKTGKITSIASVRSMNAKTGLGGSDLMIDFCSKCGNVISLTVNNPDAIK